jgi:hypothetical protein
MDTQQFYPTPRALARKAWALFQDQGFRRVLEPEAGNGDLAKAAPCWPDYQRMRRTIDCCEIDITRHPALKAKGLAVVGIDFLEMRDGAMYSHIIMNPPFAAGASHVVKAWEILWDGEIVAILNAETLRNPFSRERQHLVRLIERHGSCEYLAEAFQDPDTQRKTDVEIALVYLKKTANFHVDIMGAILDNATKDHRDRAREEGKAAGQKDLILPASFIENTVTAYNAAMTAAREAVFAQARQHYYEAFLGATLAQRNGEAPADTLSSSKEFVTRELAERYDTIKDRAWTGILRSSTVLDKLSSAAQRRVESDFETIRALEFTTSNVYGFLSGIVECQGDIQMDMACDVFDLFTRYHTDNTVFYRGWKSNDRHRTCGMRLKTTRFVLPGHKSLYRGLDYYSYQTLRDIDKVFAMLDGKSAPALSLETLFASAFEELRSGARKSASYFDVRYYPGTGTIHFFPTNKTLVDRLNRIVGRRRQWLPPEDVRVSDAFWLQYNQAEKWDKEVRAEIQKAPRSQWSPAEFGVMSSDAETREESSIAVDAALRAIQERHGVTEERIASDTQNQLLLTVA